MEKALSIDHFGMAQQDGIIGILGKHRLTRGTSC